MVSGFRPSPCLETNSFGAIRMKSFASPTNFATFGIRRIKILNK